MDVDWTEICQKYHFVIMLKCTGEHAQGLLGEVRVAASFIDKGLLPKGFING